MRFSCCRDTHHHGEVTQQLVGSRNERLSLSAHAFITNHQPLYTRRTAIENSMKRLAASTAAKKKATKGPEQLAGGECRCTVCAKLPFKQMDSIIPELAEEEACLEKDAEVYEALNKMNQGDSIRSIRLPAAAAQNTASRCARHTRRLRNELIKAGLLNEEGQKCEESGEGIRRVAPFAYSELKLGQLLGTGGFSSVFELQGFSIDSTSATFDSSDQEARQAMNKRTVLSTTSNTEKENDTEPSKVPPSKTSASPYVIKHLRRGLVKDPEKFERAAIDMVLEAQLLLAMDHPNIIALRGWSGGTGYHYANGKHTDFFVVLDRLTESLDERMAIWRHAYKKYKGRSMMPWGKNKCASKLESLLEDRLKVVLEITSALQYMHDRRIIFRDMKSANVGFDMYGQLKIYDFGLSRLLPSRRSAMADGYAMSRVGTKYYMAPEVRAKAPYNLSADLFSLGVVFWEVMSMSSPRETLQKIKKNELSPPRRLMLPICECWPSYVRSIMEHCLSMDPHLRPNISDVRTQLEREVEIFQPSINGRPSFQSSTATTSVSNSSHASFDFRSSVSYESETI